MTETVEKNKKKKKRKQDKTTILANTFSRLSEDAKRFNPITQYYEKKETDAQSEYFKKLNKNKPRTGKITNINKEHKVNPVTNKFEAVTNPPKEFKWNSDKQVYEQIKTKKVKKARGGKIGDGFVSIGYPGFK